MATRPKIICRHPGCGALIELPGYCQRHQQDACGWNRTSRASRHARGYGTYWQKLRQTILVRDKYLCQACLAAGRLVQATDVDHILPKAAGGTDEPDNLQALCRACHKQKTAKERG